MGTVIGAGWTTRLTGRYGTFLVLAVDRGGFRCCPANLAGRERPAGLDDSGPVLTVRMLGRPEAGEFNVSLGAIDFRSARSPGGRYPWAHLAMHGQFTEPVPERSAA